MREVYFVQWMLPGDDQWHLSESECSLSEAFEFVHHLLVDIPDVKYLIFKPIDWSV